MAMLENYQSQDLDLIKTLLTFKTLKLLTSNANKSTMSTRLNGKL